MCTQAVPHDEKQHLFAHPRYDIHRQAFDVTQTGHLMHPRDRNTLWLEGITGPKVQNIIELPGMRAHSFEALPTPERISELI